MNFTISNPDFSNSDLMKVDRRIFQFIYGWQLVESYQGKTVVIPDYVVFNYFEALNKPEGRDQDEKQLCIWMGWAGRSNGKDIDGLYDAECQVTLAVNGKDASDEFKVTPVNFEALKSGRASMELYWNNKLITDFTEIGKCYALANRKVTLVTARYPNGYIFGNMLDYK